METDRSAPAAKSDIDEVKPEIAIVHSELPPSFDYLPETMRDSQTGLLNAFYIHNQSNN
jgi:hypothetical protein